MVNPPKKPDDEQPDDLIYEDFDDTAWAGDVELEPINLDALDDEIPGEEENATDQPDQAAAGLLDAIDHLDDEPVPPTSAAETPSVPEETERAAAEGKTSAPVEQAVPSPAPVDQAAPAPAPVETVPETPTEAEQAPETAEPEAPPAPVVIPPEVYCVLLPLPPELGSQVLELRETGEITTMPPPGIVLTTQFRATDRAAVETALAKWARAHLPFQFETTSVLAKVVGAQQYIAAWTLEPEEEIVEAQHALNRALAELVLPMPESTMTFVPYVPIGEHIAAARYPHVIGQMQRDFEPFVWRANDLQLVRQGEKPGEWEMVKAFD
jgi:outer membrane biosynthesis protein TonB